MSRRNRKRANRPRREPRPSIRLPWRQILAGAILLAVLTIAAGGILRALDRPAAISAQVSGQRVSEMEVLSALRQFEGQGFLSLDLDAVQRAAEALPWVDRARVQRQLPARLVVTVTEQVAAARWGEHGLLNTRGELFVEESRYRLPELPALSGPEGSEWRVAQRYLEAHSLLAPLGLTLGSLSMDARGAWDLELTNGLLLRLGRDRTRRRLERFAGVVAPLLRPELQAIAYVDLRYDNGFAVGWKTGQPPAAANEDHQG